MLKIKHVPMQLFDVTMFPIMFTLLFTYLFGGALAGSPREYLQFLLPGILVLTVTMITMYTGMALNTDIGKGIFDRFRSLPIWRPAVLVGMLLADTVRYTIASRGGDRRSAWSSASGPTAVRSACWPRWLLLLVFSFSLSWVWTVIGLKMRTPGVGDAGEHDRAVPADLRQQRLRRSRRRCPAGCRRSSRCNPITHLTTASRSLMHGTGGAGEIGWVLAWSAALVAIFAPMTMRLYGKER